jgi:hypothetical protein
VSVLILIFKVKMFRLYQTLVEHGVDHLHEAGDVGAVDVIARRTALFGRLHAVFVDADHNAV